MWKEMQYYRFSGYGFSDSKPSEAKHGKGRRRLGRGERPASWRIRK